MKVYLLAAYRPTESKRKSHCGKCCKFIFDVVKNSKIEREREKVTAEDK